MKLRTLKVDDLERNLKATIHKTGKLGFTVDAASRLGLGTDRFVTFAKNEEDDADTSLYMVFYNYKVEDSIRIAKAGDYYYINGRLLFDSLGLDYVNRTITFDIIPQRLEQQEVFKLKERDNKPKNEHPL